MFFLKCVENQPTQNHSRQSGKIYAKVLAVPTIFDIYIYWALFLFLSMKTLGRKHFSWALGVNKRWDMWVEY